MKLLEIRPKKRQFPKTILILRKSRCCEL